MQFKIRTIITAILIGILKPFAFATADSPDLSSPQCQAAIKQLDQDFNMLETCYPMQSLFHQTIPYLCDTPCFDTTVRASKALINACGITMDSSPDTQDDFCMNVLFRVATNLSFHNLSTNKNKTMVELLECNNPCIGRIYRSVRGDSKRVPYVYFNMITEHEALFQAIDTYCYME
ncbi:hypothetical protein BDF19DRAFT_440249 [Syncephalis fuscata]|nr:hypothetical protein BDF19DRAFT_440249 [Syncephalis fuscata]